MERQWGWQRNGWAAWFIVGPPVVERGEMEVADVTEEEEEDDEDDVDMG